jgi:hypothetical protein
VKSSEVPRYMEKRFWNILSNIPASIFPKDPENKKINPQKYTFRFIDNIVVMKVFYFNTTQPT